ncbi:MFS transporter [Rhodoferax saidenbachensis]|uniref:MFS transporter n=2 Tax=Rhodoferax saidenbachensis TaxID=1484693 RepID=A0A1P8K954_9BURK|nr:MFS transporter [Rhodoferax saidenbachensis]
MSRTDTNSTTPRGALARLICGQICLHGSMAGMRMAAPLLALRDGYSALSVGVLLALFSLTQVFLAIPAGRYADRHGLLKPMGLGVSSAMLGAGLAVLFPNFPMLCVSALLMGGATGVAIVALQRHVGRAAQDATELKQVFSWLAIGPAVSNFLGPVAAGLLIDHAGVWLGGTAGDTNGFRAAFLFMVFMPLMTWFWVRHTQELPPVVHSEQTRNAKVWHLLREPQMRRLLLVNWLLSSCWDVHTFVVPMLGHERGFSASVIGTVLGSMAVAGASVRVLMPLVAAHLREWAVITGAMVVTAVIFAIYPLMMSPWTMGLCSVLLGLSLGAVQPMILSTLHQITPHALHGQAIGLRMMTINLSSVLMPMLFGTAGLVLGVSVVFWTVGAMVGAGARMAWKLRP